MERLTFNVGSARSGPPVVSGRQAPRRATPAEAPSRLATIRKTMAATRERYDWDYIWMLAFTTLLFFRPQDHFKPLAAMHLAELTAVAGLAAMAVRRLRAGQTIAKVNSEVIAVIVLGGVIVLTIPFSIWPSGSLTVFSDIYVKIILIFALMMSTITSPRRLQQMTWIMIVASGYIAGRGVFDYMRGVNLVEGDRLRGAVGGMFENPNDLALNLVAFLAPTLFIIVQDRKVSRRLFAGLLAVLMLGATVATKSRSGFLGLIAMGLVVFYYTARLKPGLVFGIVVAGLLALPAMPQSFWDRMDSIVNPAADPTGSRAARVRLLNQGIEAFADNPVTGIGAGQFVNYTGPGVVEKARVTHNVWLQVAAELGIFGFITFLFLVLRAYASNLATLRMLRRTRRRRRTTAFAPSALRRVSPKLSGDQTERRRKHAPPLHEPVLLTDQERVIVDTNAKGMVAALVGWTVCSLFASVAFNWTFYYVLALSVAGREIVASRRAVHTATESEAETVRVTRMVRVTA